MHHEVAPGFGAVLRVPIGCNEVALGCSGMLQWSSGAQHRAAPGSAGGRRRVAQGVQGRSDSSAANRRSGRNKEGVVMLRPTPLRGGAEPVRCSQSGGGVGERRSTRGWVSGDVTGGDSPSEAAPPGTTVGVQGAGQDSYFRAQSPNSP